ncbi:dihydrofolate reductase family protein [Gryllotalpicola reticulitermitis]|uniref:Dihydrofolate reductase family protein n=1 Tax=Gryllotalpicola reticulitermitis TaxID=1184153 RepID=A0ABV8Q8X3_9MICO
MGEIHIDLFTSLDFVAQAPGRREEDLDGGFRFGGWQAPLSDELVGSQVLAGMDGLDALLLGRRTYDIFASYWPLRTDPDNPIASLFNRVPKYVASRSALALDWAGSELLSLDITKSVAELRSRHQNIHVIGSLDFVQTLLHEQLFDRLNLWVYPVLLGSGKRIFADGAVPTSLRLTEPAVTSPAGVVALHYALVDGEPETADMTD